MSSSSAPNRLASETSPYLRQHAHNPVDWFPWGEEARAAARADGRPILLSIGYSACHWCHVMERESFENPEIARIMNDGFVNVKVDREERPDVDAIYMRAVQALTGRGGWPLTVFLTPEGLPFFGGTYFPPEPRHGIPSFPQVLRAARTAWDERQEDVRGAAGQIHEILKRSGDPAKDAGDAPALDEGLLETAVNELLRAFDPTHGGFGGAPKFPQPAVLEFLLQEHRFTGSLPPLEAALHTLRRMAAGGIRDHLGGGFHRYSVDARWLVPHFEKMLYDNALLAGVYLRAFQITGESGFEAVCRSVLEDLLDDMRAPGGGFHTARDADSEGEEGTFYLWSRAEVEEILGEDAVLFCRVYDVSEAGNFEGRNILHRPHDTEAIARDAGLAPEALEERLAAARARLAAERRTREAPLLDTKILTGWNGLAIRTFAEAGAALDEPVFLKAAAEAAARLLESLRPEGRLLHQLPESEARILAFLEDVAAFGLALLALHEATLEPRWLIEAVRCAEEIDERFRDADSGRLFDTPSDGEALVVRPRELMDNPVPSGNSLAAELHLRLARLLDRPKWEAAAREYLERQAALLARYPAGFGRALAVASRLLRPSLEIAVTGEVGTPELRSLLREAHRPFRPDAVISGGAKGAFPFPTPLLEGRGGGAAKAWVCRAHACEAPIEDPEQLRGTLEVG